MKKIIALVTVLFSVVVPIQSQAAVGERIVIIDSYFDVSRVSGSVEFICLATDKCVNKATPKPGMGTDAVNHGTIMANIAREQNASATLVLIQTEEVSAKGVITTLDGSDFVKALIWTKSNTYNVSAVSFSYNLTNSNANVGECRISAAGGSVAVMDSSIKSLVSSLKASGIPVIAAAGNFNNKPLQYPACLADVISVGSTGQSSYHQNNVSILATLSNKDKTATMKTVSPWFGSVQFTTSAATVAIAANWKSIVPSTKVVTVLSN